MLSNIILLILQTFSCIYLSLTVVLRIFKRFKPSENCSPSPEFFLSHLHFAYNQIFVVFYVYRGPYAMNPTGSLNTAGSGEFQSNI